MKNFFKLCLFVILSLSMVNAYALDDASTISEGAKKILSSLEDEFGIKNLSSTTKKKISEQFDSTLKGKWYSYWIGNEDLESSKFKDSKVRIYDLFVVNNNGVSNINFIYFPEVKQIYYIRKQYFDGPSEVILELFKEHKSKENTKVSRETDIFAFTRTEGFLDFDIFHINTPNALLACINAGVIDVK